MQILRPALTGIATMVLAGMLSVGAADLASAAKARVQAPSQEQAKQPQYQPPDRQMESRGYRRAKSPTPSSGAYEPPDRQLVSRGYRHHHRKHHKS